MPLKYSLHRLFVHVYTSFRQTFLYMHTVVEYASGFNLVFIIGFLALVVNPFLLTPDISQLTLVEIFYPLCSSVSTYSLL